jgi:hypothetical protein
MPDFNVGFVIFLGITQLDFTGPFEVLSRLGTPPANASPSKFPHAKTHVVFSAHVIPGALQHVVSRCRSGIAIPEKRFIVLRSRVCAPAPCAAARTG